MTNPFEKRLALHNDFFPDLILGLHHLLHRLVHAKINNKNLSATYLLDNK